MVPKARVIIDTDPGVDDVAALLLALASDPEDIEILLISITYGNIDVQNCLRNAVSMFHVIDKEMRWRRKIGRLEGFDTLRKHKPVVAVGAEKPLNDQIMMADYFHGADGLGGIHSSHPHHTSPQETWKTLFEKPPLDDFISSAAVDTAQTDPASPNALFTPSNRPSHLEILRVLEENPPNTITVIAIGPLTNLALAGSHAPNVLMRAKSILVMGGAISVPGNITPVGEFNTLADATAAARVFALTSPNPASTMPPAPPQNPDTERSKGLDSSTLPPYPSKHDLGDRRLNIILFPLDITTPHTLRRDEFEAKVKPLIQEGSPLAEWTNAIIGSTLRNMETLHHGHEGANTATSLHDPLCVWYALKAETQKEAWVINREEDIRVETAGQWTRGMCVIDRRDRKMREDDNGEDDEVPGDSGRWLSGQRGNRISRCVGTPGERSLAPFMLNTIFGESGSNHEY